MPVFHDVVKALIKELPPQGYVVEYREDRGKIFLWDVTNPDTQLGWEISMTSGPHVREVEHE